MAGRDNLHSRAAPTQEAVDAYISSQRRLDALSVVHRNHYAELEVHPGIGVRSLISELSVSLRGSMPEDAPNVAIHVQSDHLFVSQDVAVPAAFLITELVVLATLINSHAIMHIAAGGSAAVESQPTKPRATLRVQFAALVATPALSDYIHHRFYRILTCLS